MLRKSKNKGFSMVELIVVITVIAIVAMVLSPSLITYTERSRAQEDYSSMDEVVNAIEIAMADQNVHDEAYRYSCANNYVTYTDSSGKYGQKVADEEFWAPDGSGTSQSRLAISFSRLRRPHLALHIMEGLCSEHRILPTSF